LHTIPQDKVEELLDYCYRSQQKDDTFRFRIERENDKLKYIIIQCPDKDVAYKRGVLLHSRFGVFFEVER
jgi:hypothetical protein